MYYRLILISIFPASHLSTAWMADGLANASRKTLDAVAPLKSKKKKRRRRRDPWYTDHTRALKLKSRQLERRWRSTKLQVFLFAWKESLDAYKHAFSCARVSYFAKLIQENKNNSRFLFKTVAELTNNHAATSPQIPKIIGIRDKISISTPISCSVIDNTGPPSTCTETAITYSYTSEWTRQISYFH